MTARQRAFCRKLAAKMRRLRHEEHYDQGTWAFKTDCGTAACLAGHAVVLDGWRMLFDDYGEAWDCRKNARKNDIRARATILTGLRGLSFDVFTPTPAFNDSCECDDKEIWPEPFRTRWQAGKERKSRIAADLLDAIADGTVK